MDFGVGFFSTDETAGPAEIARLAEERGLESVFFPDHTHIPAVRRTPFPAGGDLPREYTRLYDPFVAAATAAAATTRLRIGTGILLLVQRDPIAVAKAAASIDRLSGGRLLFGVGAGWNEEEMEDHGTDPARRFGVLRERVEAVTALWTQDEASYAGEHVRFERAWCWPKPVQQSRPPVIVGGNGRGVLDRVVGYGDEWGPNYIGDAPRLAKRIARLREAGEAAGRGPLATTVFNAPDDPRDLEVLEAAGARRAVAWIGTGAALDAERGLDAWAAAASRYAGG